MTHPSKAKGNGYERELVDQAKERGASAKRAWGSDGRALGESEGVDLIIGDIGQQLRVQAKRMKALPKVLTTGKLAIPSGCDAVVTREDRGESLLIMRWAEFLDLITNPEAESE